MDNNNWWLEDSYWQADMKQVMSDNCAFIDKQKVKTTLEFHDLPITVEAGVYHPITSSSTSLIGETLRTLVVPGTTVLDMGCGYGALSFLSVISGPNHALAVDVSDIACCCAHQNVNDLSFSEKVTIIKSNLFENIPTQQFDLIVFNPPLLHSEPDNNLDETDYNLMAIDKQGGLLNRFVESVSDYLKVNGRLVLLISNIGDKKVIQRMSNSISKIGKVEVLSATFRNSGMQWRFLLSVVKS